MGSNRPSARNQRAKVNQFKALSIPTVLSCEEQTMWCTKTKKIYHPIRYDTITMIPDHTILPDPNLHTPLLQDCSTKRLSLPYRLLATLLHLAIRSIVPLFDVTSASQWPPPNPYVLNILKKPAFFLSSPLFFSEPAHIIVIIIRLDTIDK